jgi:hypothetical protein
MFSIDLRLDVRTWGQEGYLVDVDDKILAYVSAMRTVKRRLETTEIDFLPLGNDQYIIWAYGKCQGLMIIKEVGQETSAPVLGGGQ